MTKPFFDRLRNYLEAVGRVLAGQASVASVFANPTDIGTSRERVYAEVLRQHVPSSCNVFLGGFLFGADGSESRQLDIMVTVDRALQFNFQNSDGGGRAFASVDGCIGVVSVKSYLSTSELHDALANIASIPEALPLGGRVNPSYRFDDYDDWPFKVVYASEGMSSSTALSAVYEFYAAHPEIPNGRRPHVIHVAGSYVIFRARADYQLAHGILPRGGFATVTDNADVNALMLVFKSLQINAQNASQVVFNYHHLMERLVGSE
jgi:hypothetical protein